LFHNILKFINGKEYYTLSDEDKALLRDEEYTNILPSYIVISNTFIVFGLIAIFLTLKGIISLPLDSPTFFLEVAIVLFLIIVSVFLTIQKKQKKKNALSKIKFDIVINVVVLLCLTGMTITNIESGGYLSLYAVGLITFALLVRIKPSIVLFYFGFVLALVIIYVNAFDVYVLSMEGFIINVAALNIIIFFV
jgi:heme/copper-type cytochrome/quinol oxidase subunit 4